MHNITLYGNIKCNDLRNALSDCPGEYHRAFSKDGTFCAIVREDENQGPYTIIITNDVNSGIMPEIQEDMLSVMGPDTEKVNHISLKLQEKLGFEISRESMEIFDRLDNTLDHKIVYMAYEAFGRK
ncbi:Uncharacterised protein [uncultured archaeon]|nr:Uncharacterised protein [uncultured archaeon]